MLESLLEACKERDYLKVRGRQRTDSTCMLGPLRILSRLERAAEAMRAALNALAEAAPEWVLEHADPEWLGRCSRRIEDYRLLKGKEARIEYLKTVGTDGIRLLAKLDDREYFRLYVRGSPEPDGISSERGAMVSSAILLRWSRVPDPLDELKS